MTPETEIMKKLDVLQNDVSTIKKQIVDLDVVLADDDLESLDEADAALEQGKTRSL